jgi:serine/threonine protein kinase
MDAASLVAELTPACGTPMYFSPELEHSGVYNQLVDVYALGIVVFEMLHVFKTGMERTKLIAQLKSAMCTPLAMEFSKVPLQEVLVHWGAPGPTSPRASAGEEGRAKPSRDKLHALRALVKAMDLPSEVLVLHERFEFEVCLLLRLLSQKPEQRPSAIEMREALYHMLDTDRSPQHAVADKADNQEVQKLRQEVAELKKIAAHAGRGSGTAFTAAGQQANRGEISSGGGLQSPGVRSQRPGSLLVPQTQTSLMDQKSPTSPTAQARGPFKSQRSHSELNLSSLSKDAVQPPFLR